MADDIYIDLLYRGLKLGEALQIGEFRAAEAYLHYVAPMPVGSELGLRSSSGVEIGVRVTRVFEKVSGSDKIPGMMVEPSNLHGDALNWWDERVADAPEPEIVAEAPAEAEAETEAPADEIEAKVSEEERPSSDTIVMDAVSPEEISDASSTTEEAEGEPENESDTVVMEAEAPDEAPSDTEAEPAGKKNKKKRRSRRKKR